MMKRIISIILTVFLVFGSLILTVHAEESKVTQELKDAIKQSSSDDVLNLILWYAYPSCPEPGFQPEDYGEDLESVQKYIHDYRAYKKAYYTEKNVVYTDQLKDVIDIEVTYSSKYSPYILFKAKAGDIGKLEALDYISNINLISDGAGEKESEYETYESRYRAMLEENNVVRQYYSYHELFYHHDAYGETDWVLVQADSGMNAEMNISMVIAGRVITYFVDARYFKFNYGIYDVAKDKFVDLDDIKAMPELYPGLSEALWDLKIGRPLGDADNDNELTILDATRIQREMAELEAFDDEVEYYNLSVLEASRRFSDYDEDGNVTILDATAIQRTLAGLITKA